MRTRSGRSSSAWTGRGACSHAGAARSPDSAARADRAESVRSPTTGPITTGPGPNRGRSVAGGRQQVTLAAQEHHEPVALDADEGVVGGAAGRATELGGADVVERGRRRPDHDQRGSPSAPPERGDPGAQGVVDVTAHEGVDHEGFEAGVPGAADLGGAGIDLRRGERDLPGVAQHGLADLALVARGGEAVAVGLDHVHDDADQLEGVLQRDRPRELGRGGGEDVADPVRRAGGLREPGDERRDARLGHQAHPRAVLRRQRAVPLEVVVEPAHGRGGQQPGAVAHPALRLGAAARLEHGCAQAGGRRAAGSGSASATGPAGSGRSGAAAGAEPFPPRVLDMGRA